MSRVLQISLNFILLGLSIVAQSSHASQSLPILTEAQITEAETIKKASPPPPTVQQMASTSFLLPYIFQYESLRVDVQNSPNKSTGLNEASSLANSARIVQSARVGIPAASTNSLVKGLGNSMLILAALDFVTTDHSDQGILNEQFKNITSSPSLYILRLQPKPDIEPDQDVVQYRFKEVTDLLANLQIGCEPTQNKNYQKRNLVVGGYVPNSYHYRFYTCGYGIDEELIPHGFTQMPEYRKVAVQMIGTDPKFQSLSNGTFSVINLNSMHEMPKIVQQIDPNKEHDKADLPKLLYNKIKDNIPDGWYVLYTETVQDNKKIIMFGQKDNLILFDKPFQSITNEKTSLK